MRIGNSVQSPLRLELMTAVSALVAMIAVGTVAYHFMEGWSWLDSFYFAACTLTTVGYGDFAPTTDLSRLFTALYVLAGVSIAFATFSLLGLSYIERSQRVLFRDRGAK